MNRSYLKRRNGDEYYPPDGSFLVDDHGRQVYARDRHGNEQYPKTKTFAQDADGKFYYARDKDGNEFYPMERRKSVVMKGRHARTADGTQRYPHDDRGNEYYLTHDERPYLMRRNTGETYLARNRKGHNLIPWNYLHEFNSREPHVCAQDAVGNTVYLQESVFPLPLKVLIRCLCHISVICPNIVRCY